MRTRRTKELVGPPELSGAVSESDLDMLIAAYRSGLIAAWKRDSEQGYRLTLGSQDGDAYVESSNLTRYLDRLRRHSS